MTKEALKLALEALENLFGIPDKWTGEGGGDVAVWRLGGSYRAQQAITAIKEALANEALEKMAENARELGLDYEPAQKPCGGCKGSGWVTRDPDIGTDQECFVCGGSGAYPKEPEQEPYCYTYTENGEEYFAPPTAYVPDNAKPLYTTPPQRTWVGLTDGEVDKMILLMGFPPDWITENAIVKNIVRNLEAKLKEKNG